MELSEDAHCIVIGGGSWKPPGHPTLEHWRVNHCVVHPMKYQEVVRSNRLDTLKEMWMDFKNKYLLKRVRNTMGYIYIHIHLYKCKIHMQK